jgi:hypothetical protein
MGQNNANPVGDACYTLVLKKLKHMLVNSFYLMDEVRYVYDWDAAKSVEANRKNVMQEDAALTYFLSIGVIDGVRIDNAYRTQELQARALNPSGRVWADWDKADNAYREYEWIVLIHGMDVGKFDAQLEKFNLMDNGVELGELHTRAKTSPVKGRLGSFTAHKDGTVLYQSSPVELKPEVKRLVHTLVVKNGVAARYEDIVDALWNEENNSLAYIENPNRTRRDISKRISTIASEANSALYAYDSKKHLASVGGTSYKFVA